MFLKAVDAGIAPLHQHGKGDEVDLLVAMGRNVVIFPFQVMLVEAKPIEHKRGDPVGAFERPAEEWRVLQDNVPGLRPAPRTWP